MAAAAIVNQAQAVPPGGEKLALELLCKLLQKEHAALLAQEAHQVNTIAIEKQALLDQLAVFIRARTSRGPRMARHMAHSMDPALRDLWRKVSAMNATNGAVLQLHQNVVNRALGVMRHAVSVDGPYTARGKLAGHYLNAL